MFNKARVRDTATTLWTVWQRGFLDAVVAPRRFRQIMPELRRVSDMLYHPGIASLDPSRIPGSETPIQILNLDSTYGGMPPQDLYTLLRVVRWAKPKKIFEIGTFQGMTTAHLALHSDAEIYTLDLPRELAGDLQGYSSADRALLQSREEIGRAYRRINANGRIQQLFGDSRTFDFRPYRGSIDLVLVDACHLFDYVMSDSRNAFEMLGDQGVILWHDFGNSGDVNRALKVLAKQVPIHHLEGTHLAMYARGVSLSEKLQSRPDEASSKSFANGASGGLR